MYMGTERENGTYKKIFFFSSEKFYIIGFYNIHYSTAAVLCTVCTYNVCISNCVHVVGGSSYIAKLMLYSDIGINEFKNNDCGIAHSLSTLLMKIYNIQRCTVTSSNDNLQSVALKHNKRLVITKGYGERVTTIKGQNAFAATLSFV